MCAVVGYRSALARDMYWMEDDFEVWLPAEMVAHENGQVTLQKIEGSRVIIPEDMLANLERVKDEQLIGVDDICALPEVNNGAMLHTVRHRYNNGHVYTRVARVLIAMNPFRMLPIYSSEHLDSYAGCMDTTELPPHIFAISQDALLGVTASSCDHVILISGESGAGKTESAKLILSYIAEAARGGEGGVEEKVLRCSPIFESFGNAVTSRNTNSSRFGKWLDITFCGKVSSSETLQISDSMMTQYLLETTRVCGTRPGDRNYHVFYQLLKAKDSYPEFELGEPMSYYYLQGSNEVAVGIDDSMRFKETLDAFGPLGFCEDMQKQVFRAVAAVLTLGNIDFRNADSLDAAIEVATQESLEKAAKLLTVTVETLSRCMLFKSINVAGNEVQTNHTVESARAVRDTVAKTLYGRLFEWLVFRMNCALSKRSNTGSQSGPDSFVSWEGMWGEKAKSQEPVPQTDQRSIGVLDIAGFESFETNSLEQLLINLSNEHLQQSFNHTIVKSELENFSREGIDLTSKLTFRDNIDILELIDGKNGVLDILDEEGTMPKGNAKGYASKVSKAHEKNPRFVAPRFGGKPKFGLVHFAGEVTYSCDGFLEKNIQKLPAEVTKLFCESSLELVQEFGKNILQEAAGVAEQAKGGVRTLKKPNSASYAFRESLKSLMTKIKGAERHYVRCVKPNQEKLPGRFTSKMVMEQLLFSGVMEAVRIRQQGFAMRLPFQDFVMRFRCIPEVLYNKRRTGNLEAAQLVEMIKDCPDIGIDAEELAVGNAKVFAKTSAVNALEAARGKAMSKFAMTLQACCRAYIAIKRFKAIKDSAQRITASLDKVGLKPKKGSEWGEASKHFAARSVSDSFPPDDNYAAARDWLQAHREILRDNSRLNYQSRTTAIGEEVARRLEQELDCYERLGANASSLDPVVIEKTMARARGLGLVPPPTMVKRYEKLTFQLPLVKAMTQLLESNEMEPGKPVTEDFDELDRLGTIVRTAGPCNNDEEWLPELGGEQLYEKILAIHEALTEFREEAERLRAKEKQQAEEEETRLRTEMEKEQSEAQNGVEVKASVTELPEPTSRRRTITGVTPDDQEGVLKRLTQSVAEFNALELEQLLTDAASNGYGKNDLAPSKLIFEQLQDEAFVVDALKTAEAEANFDGSNVEDHEFEARKSRPPTELQVKRLQNLSEQLGRLRSRKSGQTLPSLIQVPEEENNIEPLTDFAAMRPARTWKGHARTVRKSLIDLRMQKEPSQVDQAQMLCHSKLMILEALTYGPSEEQATQSFRDILVWMGDWPAQDCQRQGALHALLSRSRFEGDVRDEIFVQMMKQLTPNAKTGGPSAQAEEKAWKLMQILCSSTPPSDSLAPFLRSFLKSRPRPEGSFNATDSFEDDFVEWSKNPRGAAKAFAERCLDALDAQDAMPRQHGHLWKKKPKGFIVKPYDWRYVHVRNMDILYWGTVEDASAPEAARPTGGPLCRGMVNLLANDCEVSLIEGSTTGFVVKAIDGTWTKNAAKTAVGTSRVYTFDASGSEYTAQQWMDVIQVHIQQAKLIREQLDGFERVPSMHHLVSQPDTIVEVVWTWSDARRPSKLKWSKPKTLEQTGIDMKQYRKLKSGQRPVTIQVTTYSANAPCASSEISVINIFEAIAIIRELSQARRAGIRKKSQRRSQITEARFNFLNEEAKATAENVAAGKHPPTIWKVGDTVYYARHESPLPDGSTLPYGAKGVVARAGEERDGFRIGVQFHTISFTIQLSGPELSGEKPPAILAGGWQVGETAWHNKLTTELDDGSMLEYGTRGKVIGPGESEDTIAILYTGVSKGAVCKLVDVSREQPPTNFGKGWFLGDLVLYRGVSKAIGQGVSLEFGTTGKVVGPDFADKQRVVVHFDGVSVQVSCAVKDLGRPEEDEMASSGEVEG